MTYQASAKRNSVRSARTVPARNNGRADAERMARVQQMRREQAIRQERQREYRERMAREEAARAERERIMRIRAEREERRRAAARAEEKRRLEYFAYCEKKLKEERRAAKRKERAEQRAKAKAEQRAAAKREIKVERKKLSFPFVAILAIAAIMLSAVILSCAQVSETSRIVSDQKTKLDRLTAQKEELTFALEEKNDVRLIEKIATEKIGMVKEGSVTKRYVSLSEGDSIEIENQGETESGPGTFGTVLSALSGMFENIRDFMG